MVASAGRRCQRLALVLDHLEADGRPQCGAISLPAISPRRSRSSSLSTEKNEASGIGYGVAKEFVGAGYRVFGSVRKEEDAARLADELGEGYVPLLFDVTDREAVAGAATQVRQALGTAVGLAGLVNNAGIALSGPLMHQPLEEVRAHFEVNVIGLVSVTQAFLPLLGAGTRPGRIVNASSVGGKVAGPFIGAYVGTKHAVEGISDSLRRELLPYGIDVIVVRPGAVKTEIWGKGSATGRYDATDYARPLEAYEGYMAGLAEDGYPPEEFGRLVRKAFEAKRPKTRYVFVRGKLTNRTIPSLLPDRVLDRIVGRNLGLASGFGPGQRHAAPEARGSGT
jgi:NAD(P)-dependent dehydrogenase (short-subunit alcohol dehydrogenase family)